MTRLATPSADPARHPPPAADGPAAAVDRARRAQPGWAETPIKRRLAVLRRARRLMVDRADALAATVTHASRRNDAETLASEVMPLVEAARYLERRASRVLRPRNPRAGRPITGLDLRLEITRQPWGAVLIIGPGNYPLMLPGVQALQALAAGNAVLLKPGGEGALAAGALRDLLVDAGLPADLFNVLDERPDAGLDAINARVDHIVLTGSEPAGRAVAHAAARTLTPLTAELGGHDAAIVLDHADLDLTARALVFGLTANRGATCIAPRRLYATAQTARQLETRLAQALPTNDPPPDQAPDHTNRLQEAIQDALSHGAHPITPSPSPNQKSAIRNQNLPLPLVLTNVPPDARVMHEDLFAAVLAICPVDSIDEAVRHANACRYRLGASVFGPPRHADALAARLHAGCVTVNDLIAPVADPRLPLAGRGASGFGVTRGDEGLLAMTQPKTHATRRGRRRPHYQPPDARTAALIRAYLHFAHGRSLRQRLVGLRRLFRAIRGQS